MIPMILKNYQNYDFVFTKDNEGGYSIQVKDLFDRDLGRPNKIIFTGLGQVKVEQLNNASPILRKQLIRDQLEHIFKILIEQSTATGGRAFNIEFKKDRKITAVIIAPYGLPGGGWNNLLGVLTSVAVTVGGTALIAATGGLAAGPVTALLSTAGTAGFFGAGVSGVAYSVTTADDKMDSNEFMIRTSVGFVAGSASGGMSTALAPASNVGTTILGNMARSAATNVSSTVVSTFTEAVVRDDERVLNRLSPAGLALQAAGGALGEQAGSFVSAHTSPTIENMVETAMRSQPVQAVVKLSDNTVRKVSYSVSDGTGGASGSVAGRVTANVVTGKHYSENVTTAAIVGGVSGTLHGYRRAELENSRIAEAKREEERIRAAARLREEQRKKDEQKKPAPEANKKRSEFSYLKKPSAETLTKLEQESKKLETIFKKGHANGFISKADMKAIRDFRANVKQSTQNGVDIPKNYENTANQTVSFELKMLIKKVDNVFTQGRKVGTITDNEKLDLKEFRDSIPELTQSNPDLEQKLGILSEATIRFQAAMMLNQKRMDRGESCIMVDDEKMGTYTNHSIPETGDLSKDMQKYTKNYLKHMPRAYRPEFDMTLNSIINDSEEKINAIENMLADADNQRYDYNQTGDD